MRSPAVLINGLLVILLSAFVATYGFALVEVMRSPAIAEILSLANRSKIFRHAVGATPTVQWDFSLLQRRKKRTSLYLLQLPVRGERGNGILLATFQRARNRFVLKKLIFDRSPSSARTKARRKHKVRIKISAADRHLRS